MHKISGKLVNIGRITLRKTSERLSTTSSFIHTSAIQPGAQVALLPKVIPLFAQHFSPLKITPSPLSEHYLYPVSTAPTIRTTKGKLKKGNK
jgi:hypothetical protein